MSGERESKNKRGKEERNLRGIFIKKNEEVVMGMGMGMGMAMADDEGIKGEGI